MNLRFASDGSFGSAVGSFPSPHSKLTVPAPLIHYSFRQNKIILPLLYKLSHLQPKNCDLVLI